MRARGFRPGRAATAVAVLAALGPAGIVFSREPALPLLGTLAARLSEPDGHFDSDNLVSNETAYLQVADQLERLGLRGGAYLGVGPEQNFSYLPRVRPRWAFILDIRRDNLLQHLLFNWILETAEEPAEYLCRLLSRPCPRGLARGRPLVEVLRAVEAVPPREETLEAGLRAAFTHIEGRLAFPLSEADRGALRRRARAYFEGQLELRFESHRQGRRRHHPTYRALVLARSPSGRFGHFLSSPEDYRVVRDLARAGRLVPVVGDFAGPSALPRIGAFLRERRHEVSAFYVSNVEFYLFRNDVFDRFAANVAGLPRRPGAVFIRACFGYAWTHPATLPGHRSATVLQRLEAFLKRQGQEPFATYEELALHEYLR
jgi:hypothetical protein